MVLEPNWRMQDPQNVGTLGVGIDRTAKILAPNVWKAFILAYQHVNRTGYTPLKLHISWGAALNKPGGKASTPAAKKKRVVHRFDEQGKAFYTQKMKAKKKSPSHGTHMQLMDSCLFAGESLQYSSSRLPCGKPRDAIAQALA